MVTHQTDPHPLSGVRARALPRPKAVTVVLFDSVKPEAREDFAKTAWCEGKMSNGVSGHPQNLPLGFTEWLKHPEIPCQHLQNKVTGAMHI